MKALVTGATGFLGRHLVRRLMREHEITHIVGTSRSAKNYIGDIPLDDPFGYREVCCDVTNENEVAQLMLLYKPDIVFHMAANPIVKEDRARPTEISRTNILATHILLAYAQPLSRFVFASSATVYGNDAFDWAHEAMPANPNAVYGATKAASEALVNAYHHLGRVSGLSLRYVANVGEGATHGVVKDIIAKLKGDNPYLELLGDRPGSTKHYVHVSDTVEATVLLGLTPGLSGAVNVANDDQLNIEELAQVIMDTLGIHKPLKWLGEGANWKGDNRVVRVDNSLAKRWGWRPLFPRSADAVAHAVCEIDGLGSGKYNIFNKV